MADPGGGSDDDTARRHGTSPQPRWKLLPAVVLDSSSAAVEQGPVPKAPQPVAAIELSRTLQTASGLVLGAKPGAGRSDQPGCVCIDCNYSIPKLENVLWHLVPRDTVSRRRGFPAKRIWESQSGVKLLSSEGAGIGIGSGRRLGA